jgi:hypothetical protein
MKKILVPLHILLVVALLMTPLVLVRAQTSSSTQKLASTTAAEAAPDALFRTIQTLDTQLFDAYNRCDLEKFGSFMADDLEFYHDKTGLSRGRPALVEAIKNNICGKVTRELLPGTLEVYPIAGYGAVELGVHRFHHPGQETADSIGEAKFIHLWQNKDGAWKVTRVISFDHQSMSQAEKK